MFRVHVVAAATGVGPEKARAQHVVERGVSVLLGPSFYRPQSCLSRDLAVLSAAAHRRARWQEERERLGGAALEPPLHVLDVMGGSGIRAARYLQQAGADHVLCNEGDASNSACLESNLAAAAHAAAAARAAAAAAGGSGHAAGLVVSAAAPGGGRAWRMEAQQQQQQQQQQPEAQQPDPPLCEMTHEEAVSLLARCRLEGRFYDLIDCDAFGAAAHCVGATLDAVRWGGLVCLTATSGPIAGGRDPASAWALYAQHLAPVPHTNEQGLRSLIGLAHREATARRLSIQPLWSLYSPHGPVFRAMLRVTRQSRHAQRAQQQQQDYGYTLHFPDSCENSSCGWQDLPAALLAAGGAAAASGASPPLLSGPLWLGPLHDHAHLQQLQEDAAARGWLSGAPAATDASGVAVLEPTKKGSIASLGQLLELLLEEAAAEGAGRGAGSTSSSTPQQQQQQAAAQQEAAARRAGEQAQQRTLPPWHVRMNDVGRAGQLVGPPARAALAAELRRRGHLAALSHIDPAGLRTTASMAEAVEAAVAGLGIRTRAFPPA